MSTRPLQVRRPAELVLTAAIVELTLTTAYIHYSLGGLLFTLNAAGYVGLAAAVAVTSLSPFSPIGRLGWLARLALGGYTLVTIGAYLAMGPYFALGWVAKAVEVAILTLLAAGMRDTIRAGRSYLQAVIS
jgi:hypothetical protein